MGDDVQPINSNLESLNFEPTSSLFISPSNNL